MKALTQKGWLGSAVSVGALAVADGHTEKVAPEMDYSVLPMPPYMRCDLARCNRAGTCTNGLACLAPPSEGVDALGMTFAV